jgi:hypothetical protein
MDQVLKNFVEKISERTCLEFPQFADEAVHTAPFLAVLEIPDNSGAERSRKCSLDNDDPTAKLTLRIVTKVGIKREQIVFWNFYAAYKSERNRKFWARELEGLIKEMPKLRAIVAFGDEAWRGMRDVDLRKGIALLGARHPSNRGCNPDTEEAEQELTRVWSRAKALL